MKSLLIFTFSIISFLSFSQKDEYELFLMQYSVKLNLKDIPNSSLLDVKGKKFIEEGEASFQEGCEGCGNLGSFEFKKNGKEVEYLRPGSDIRSFSTYKQNNNQVNIEEEKISFTVTSDGNQLVDNETGTIYNLILLK